MPHQVTKTVDILREIPVNGVEDFCQILERDWPNSIHVYYFIKTQQEWKRSKGNGDIQVSLLCMADGFEDGTFVGIMYSELGGCTLLAYTQEESCERLTKALRETRRIKWSDQLMFEAVLQKHAAAVHSVVREKGLQTSVYSQSSILYMPYRDAINLQAECPAEVYAAPLQQSHLPYIHSVWAHNDVYTLGELERTLRLNSGFGVFDATNHRLLSWILHTHYGGLGVLQTRAGHQGRGYARIVVTALSQALATAGVSPHATVMDSNFKSLSLFRSVGYKNVSSIQYITVHNPQSGSSS